MFGSGLTRPSTPGVLARPESRTVLIGGASLLAFWMLVLLVRELDAPMALMVLIALLAAAPLLLRPELATIAVIFLLYTNIPVLATYQGVPFLLASGFLALLGIPLLHFVIARREPIRSDAILALMLVLLGVMLVSALRARGTSVAMGYILTFVAEGLLLYWLLVNTVRSTATIRRVLWTMLGAGALLGALTTYQEVTGNYHHDFYGLAARNYEIIQLEQMDPEDPAVAEMLQEFDGGRNRRAKGPVNEPNRFAQILLVLLPLGVHLHRTAERRRSRIVILTALVLVCCGVVFSNSRGALVGFAVMALAAGWTGWVKRSHLLMGALALALAVPIFTPRYAERALSLINVTALAEGAGSKTADGAIRGRATEMIAAVQAFVDHPVLGVGPAQYMRFYAVEYQQKDPRFKFRDLRQARRAHSLYAELPAELGVLGTVTFFGIFGVLIRRLIASGRTWRKRRPEAADLATAFVFSLFGWLVTSLFLHLAYQRYLWLLVGLAGALLHVLRSAERSPQSEGAAVR